MNYIYKGLLQFCLWREIPLKLLKVYIINVQDCGTFYHNYKGFFSIILLEICDAKYNFTYVTLGEYGSNNGSCVLQNSGLHDLFGENKMGLSPSKKIPSCSLPSVPYFVGMKFSLSKVGCYDRTVEV